jgi:hypothetical protein
MESNSARVDEAVRACVKAEADYRSAGRDWQASVMVLLEYDARQPRGGEDGLRCFP